MQTAKNEPIAISVLAGHVWRDFVRARRALFGYELVFELLKVWVLAAGLTFALSVILSRAGHIALANRDILDFMLSPAGLLYASLFLTAAVTLLLLEQGGIMSLVALAAALERPSVAQMVRAAAVQPLRVAQLGAIKVALLALTFLPFLVLAAVTYGVFLSRHDINFYLEDRPPVFWWAASIGGVVVLGAFASGIWLAVRWAFALPIVLFENQYGRAALRASRDRVRGASWRIGLIVFGWLFGSLLLGMALLAGFRLVAGAVLAGAGERPVVLTLVLLLTQCALVATLSFVTVTGQAQVTWRLYRMRSEALGLVPEAGSAEEAGTEKPTPAWSWRVLLLYVPFILLPLALWISLSRYAAERPLARVTAHCGHSLAAPENTASAVRKAIESGSDYAEVDVQRTADGVVVLLRDSDLKRAAGEQIPTLAEIIAISRGRIKLNIELKPFGSGTQLARDVARLVRDQDFERDCIVTSFNYDALQEAKQVNPRLRVGLIVAFSIGDLHKLKLEALSLRADWLSDALLREAHRQEKEVHVWTVNDASQMARLIKRGVDNIITDDPDLGIRVRNEWAGLTGPERLVLAARLLLGLDP